MNNLSKINQIYTYTNKVRSELEKINKHINRDLEITSSISNSLLEKLISHENNKMLESKNFEEGVNISSTLPIKTLENLTKKLKKYSNDFRNQIIDFSNNNLKNQTNRKTLSLKKINTKNLKTSKDFQKLIYLIQTDLDQYTEDAPDLHKNLSISINLLNSFFKNASTNPVIIKSNLFNKSIDENENSKAFLFKNDKQIIFYENLLKIIGHLESSWRKSNKETNNIRQKKINDVFSAMVKLENKFKDLSSSDRIHFFLVHPKTDMIYKNLEECKNIYTIHSKNKSKKIIKSNQCPFFNQVFDKSSQFRNNKHLNSFHIFIYRELYQLCIKEKIKVKVIDEIMFILFPNKNLEPRNLRGYVKDLKKTNKIKQISQVTKKRGSSKNNIF